MVLVAAARRALRRSVPTERPAGVGLGGGRHTPDMVDADASASRARTFRQDASCEISLSSVRCTIASRSRLFSISRSFTPDAAR
ncbi:hypothetical protein D3272_25185 [Lichenibacterium ramalinae]|uniref:Uncharacterized protein n=1 Tax=Lichenibacterium ramalinae TaxID=2316527 RepID=A0A4Q2R7G0_9HYPH|nr:hypothetical protein D3272_25185 [Lichenibacterium ramalinae]